MELWDIYDRFRHKTGKVHQRSIPLVEGDYHLVIHVWIVNNKGEFLIQRRQPWKKGWPGMWDCAAAGSAIQGDSSIDAVIRETKEEIGIDINKELLEHIFTIDFKRGFDDVWLVRQDVDIRDLKLQEEEVADAKWVTSRDIKSMIKSSKFIAYSYFDRLLNIIESNISLRKASVDDANELLELQKEVFMPFLLRYEDYETSPATQTMDRFTRRFDIGDYYKILFNDALIGSIYIHELDPGVMKLHIINILEEYQGRGIAQAVIKRIEAMYPQAYRWELETILSEPRNCYLYEKMGYVRFGENKVINDKLTLINYRKDKNISRIEEL